MDKEKTSYWFVGASFNDGTDDQTDYFCDQGIWVNGYTDKHLDEVRRIKVGEQIAIKSTYTRKNNLPFEANGNTASVMGIKAIGVVTENMGDGRNLKVDWTRFPEKKEWFFYTQRGTIWEVKRGKALSDALIDFTFNDKPQDYELFRNDPYWKERFGETGNLQININLSKLKEYQDEFLKHFPECDSFQSNAYISQERNYKVELQKIFEDSCRARFEDLPEDREELLDLAKNLMGLFTVKLLGMGNRPQNLVGWRYIDFMRAFNEDQSIEFVRAVSDLLNGDPSLEDRIKVFQAILVELIAKTNNKSSAAQLRSITSFYLSLYDVHNYGFIKTQELSRAIDDLAGIKVFGHENELTVSFEFFKQVKLALESMGWKPRDLIDVQSFLYVCQAYSADDVTKSVPLEEGTQGDYKMKTEEICLEPLNQILYGPPGTGKTFYTVNKSLQILDPGFYELHKNDRGALHKRFQELKQESRIGFVTFHQSFSYEDFVEGLKASSEDGRIVYEVSDGIFKRMCEEFSPYIEKESSAVIDVNGRTIWKMSLGNTLGADSYVYDKCIEIDEIRLGYGEDVDFNSCNSRKEISGRFIEHGYELKPQDYQVTSVDIFKNQMKAGDIVIVSDGNSKFRAIAEVTGDYQCLPSPDFPDYGQTRKVIWHRVYEKSLPYERIMNKKFSQMTLYKLSNKTVDLGKLQSLLATNDSRLTVNQPLPGQDKRVLIIDEINRGNISSIFGELITLIEPSKRAGAEEALSVTLPYSKETFQVPSNLYLIGTMNTADRSLALMDTALRRRFDFVEMMPDVDLLDGVVVEDINIKEMLRKMNQRIEVLYDREHTLGHAFFMPLKDETDDEKRFLLLKAIFANKILPLLEEYFFEDWDKIRLVLGDLKKLPEYQFISENGKDYNSEALFGKDIDLGFEFEERKSYTRNNAALMHPESYLGIYAN